MTGSRQREHHERRQQRDKSLSRTFSHAGDEYPTQEEMSGCFGSSR